MRADAALRMAMPRLRAAGIDDASGDCRRLMAFALGIGPDRLTLHLGDEMTGAQEVAFEAAVAARVARRLPVDAPGHPQVLPQEAVVLTVAEVRDEPDHALRAGQAPQVVRLLLRG